ncbi:MAG: isoprenylcysteine carboxylmethyltransferase family protein, partial [Spirochaetaceae bacterium]|nr:isoprenylcysteine carboxylmethyltransferase family protein [Spirochaetaceae bacterium]
MTKSKLLISAFTKYLMGLFFVGLLLFLPAGTFDFPNAWLFIALLFVPMLILGIVLFIKSPELLEKRLNAKEKENTQKSVVLIAGIIFLGMFILAGLDFRFNLSYVPTWCVILSSVILLVSYGLYAEVMRENAYLSRTV